MKKFLHKPVMVKFHDHAEGEALVDCAVFGCVVKEDEFKIMVRHWHCIGLEDSNFNHEHYSILKSAIYEITELKLGKVHRFRGSVKPKR